MPATRATAPDTNADFWCTESVIVVSSVARRHNSCNIYRGCLRAFTICATCLFYTLCSFTRSPCSNNTDHGHGIFQTILQACPYCFHVLEGQWRLCGVWLCPDRINGHHRASRCWMVQLESIWHDHTIRIWPTHSCTKSLSLPLQEGPFALYA